MWLLLWMLLSLSLFVLSSHRIAIFYFSLPFPFPCPFPSPAFDCSQDNQYEKINEGVDPLFTIVRFVSKYLCYPPLPNPLLAPHSFFSLWSSRHSGCNWAVHAWSSLLPPLLLCRRTCRISHNENKEAKTQTQTQTRGPDTQPLPSDSPFLPLMLGPANFSLRTCKLNWCRSLVSLSFCRIQLGCFFFSSCSSTDLLDSCSVGRCAQNITIQDDCTWCVSSLLPSSLLPPPSCVSRRRCFCRAENNTTDTLST